MKIILPILCLACQLLHAETLPISLRGMGYVTGLETHPLPPHDLYARTDVGGIFRWDRDGSRWLPLLDGMANTYPDVLAVDALALDPSDPDRLYIAFGRFVYEDNGHNGVLRSTDRGQSWELTSFPATLQVGGNSHWRHCGSRMAVDPNQGAILYYGTRENGLWRSVDHGDKWVKISGVPEGTNGGAFNNGRPVQGGISFVLVDPAETTDTGGPLRSRDVWLGIMGEGVYRSVDGGNSFSWVPGQPSTHLHPIQGVMASDGTVYLTLSSSEGEPENGAVWRYRNDSWTVITPPQSNFTWSLRNWSGIAVHPQDADTIALTDRNLNARDTFLSNDAGDTWRIHTPDPASAFTPGHHRAVTYNLPGWWNETNQLFSWSGGVRFDPADPKHLWISTGYGIYRHSDITAASGVWDADHFMEGLEMLVGTRTESLAAISGGGVLLGAMDMPGFVMQDTRVPPDASIGTLPIANSTGLSVAPQTGAMVVTLMSHDYSTGQVVRSLNHGASWQVLASANSYGETLGGDVAISATDPDRILWIPFNEHWYPNEHPPRITTDGGETWQSISGLPDRLNGMTVWNGASNKIVADAVNGQVFYVYVEATANPWVSRVYRSTDGGHTFHPRDAALPDFWRSILRVRPGVEGELWFSDTRSHLARSTDGGNSFSTFPGWSSVNAYGFGVQYSDESWPPVFVVGDRGQGYGLYVSHNHGADWERQAGLAHLPLSITLSVTGDTMVPGLVYLAFGGRGFMTVDLLAPTSSFTAWLAENGLPPDTDPEAMVHLPEGALTYLTLHRMGASRVDDVWQGVLQMNLAPAYLGSERLQIRFPARANRIYQLQGRENLQQGDWINLGEALHSEADVDSQTLSLDLDERNQMFFRLRIVEE